MTSLRTLRTWGARSKCVEDKLHPGGKVRILRTSHGSRPQSPLLHFWVKLLVLTARDSHGAFDEDGRGDAVGARGTPDTMTVDEHGPRDGFDHLRAGAAGTQVPLAVTAW